MPTGVARVVSGFHRNLKAETDITVIDYALSLRRYASVAAQQSFPAPAGLLTRAWQRFDHPKLELFLRGNRPQLGDIIHGTNFVVPPSKFASRIVTVHDVTPFAHPEWCTPASRRYATLVRRAVAGGAHVHAVSQATADALVSHVSIRPDNIHVLYPGIDSPQAFAEVSRARPYLLAVGTIEPRKNYMNLIRAFHTVAATTSEIELVIVGGAGWGSEDVRDAVVSSNAHDRIHLLGHVSEAQRVTLLRNAQVLVYPSLLEGFGYPPLEAMQVGTPAIVSDLPVMREICGSAAQYASPHDVDSIASAITSVLSNAHVRGQMVDAGYAQAEKYQWPIAAIALADLYRKIAS